MSDYNCAVKEKHKNLFFLLGSGVNGRDGEGGSQEGCQGFPVTHGPDTPGLDPPTQKGPGNLLRGSTGPSEVTTQEVTPTGDSVGPGSGRDPP